MVKLHQLLGVRELHLTLDRLKCQLAWVLVLLTLDLDSSSSWRLGGKSIDGHWIVLLFSGRWILRCFLLLLGGRNLMVVDGDDTR